MKSRIRIPALLGASILGLVLSAAAAEVKIAVVDPQQILDDTKTGKKIKQMLADYVQTRQRTIQSEEIELKRLETERVSQESVSSASAKQEKEKMFEQKLAAYQRRLQELDGEVQTKKREALGAFTKAIEQAVQQIAEKENIVLVLEKGGSRAGTLILYNQDSLDLTGRVVQALDSKGEQ